MSSVASVFNFLFNGDAFFEENAATQPAMAAKEPACGGTFVSATSRGWPAACSRVAGQLFALPRLVDDDTWAYPETHPFRAPGKFAPSHSKATWPPASVGHTIRVQKWSGYRQPSYEPSSPSPSTTSSTPSSLWATHPGVPYRIERRPLYTSAASDSVSSSSSSGTESGFEGPRTPGPVDRLAEKLERGMHMQEWKGKAGYSPVVKVQEVAQPHIHSPKPSRVIHVASFEAMLNQTEETAYDGDVDEYDL